MIAAPAMKGARLAASAFACTAVLLASGCATSTQSAQAAEPSQSEPGKSKPSLSNQDCMFSVVVKDWAALDEQRFIIYGLTRHEPYLATLFFPTPDLINNIGMVVIDDDHNGRICGQSGDSVQFRNPTIPGRNTITSLQKITEEEAKALLAEHARRPRKEKAATQKPAEPAAQDPVALTPATQ
ncbi:MAG: DUF6491 family protein [Pseudomonadota bacterium]